MLGILFKIKILIILFNFINCKNSTREFNSCSFILPWNINNEKSLYALVLARGGSKGVLRKNLQKLNKISLLGRTLIQLNKSQLFSEIWVSTEDIEISYEAEKYGALVHKRPNYLANDTTSSLDTVKEFLEKYNYVKNLALFQCTSVFLKYNYIKEAVTKFFHTECVFSVTQSFKLRWRLYDLSNGLVEPINFELEKRPRRQDWLGEFYENGMFYFATRGIIMKRNALQNKYCKIVIIPQPDDLEIDTWHHLELAQFLLSKNKLETP